MWKQREEKMDWNGKKKKKNETEGRKPELLEQREKYGDLLYARKKKLKFLIYAVIEQRATLQGFIFPPQKKKKKTETHLKSFFLSYFAFIYKQLCAAKEMAYGKRSRKVKKKRKFRDQITTFLYSFHSIAWKQKFTHEYRCNEQNLHFVHTLMEWAKMLTHFPQLCFNEKQKKKSL